jgi:hypothetical protein
MRNPDMNASVRHRAPAQRGKVRTVVDEVRHALQAASWKVDWVIGAPLLAAGPTGLVEASLHADQRPPPGSHL